MSDPQFSFAVRNAVIDCCGKVFFYKEPLIEMLVTAGVPVPACDRHRDHVKYQLARAVLADLDSAGARGRTVQWQIVDALLDMDGPADDKADPTGAREALATLRKIANRRRPAVAVVDPLAAHRRLERERRLSELRQSKERIDALKVRFSELALIRNPQERGYAFEPFLRDLFQAHKIEYRGSYRNRGEQIDGAFKHGGREWLVEARWRALPPDASDLLAFAHKVDTKLIATLGLFITMQPPDVSVLEHVAAHTRALVIADGADLTAVLERRLDLGEMLDLKLRAAAQEGRIYAPAAAPIAA